MQHPASAFNQQAFVVQAIKDEAKNIRSYELAREDHADLPAHEPGAHLAVQLENDLIRQYSLFDEPGDGKNYRIAVLKDPKSRGGSLFLHDRVTVGDKLLVSGPFNNFPLATDSASALLIAGGIGITPILSMAHHLYRLGTPFSLYYCARDEREAAFVDFLKNTAAFKHCVQLYFDGGVPGKGLNVEALLQEPIDGCHIYCCGPTGLMDAVQASAAHWPAGSVHFERFKADTLPAETNTPFRVYLRRANIELEVPCEKSILQVLKEAGLQHHSVCEQGVCGACLTDVAEGTPDHRDHILTDEEKSANDVMAICCSRSKSGRLVLDI